MEAATVDPTTIPAVSWSEFQADFSWQQGEHMTLIAPTGWGKTTLAQELLAPGTRPAPWVAIISTKRRDPIIDQFTKRGYRKMQRWIVTDCDITPRVVLAPKISGFKSIDKQRDVFREALDSIFRQTGWAVFLDEMRYLTEYLGLRREVEVLLQQGRSAGITVIGGAQRPRHVPLVAFDQARHLFFGFDNDKQNVKRLGEIGGGVDPRAVEAAIRGLNNHEFLYINTQPPATMVRTRVEL